MALPASTVSPSRLRINKLFKDQPCQLHKFSPLHASHRNSRQCSIKLTMAQFNDPNKLKAQINVVRERLWEAIPDPVKDFPWKKAEVTLLQRLLFLGKKALGWSFVALFVFSFLSDVIFSVSMNKELMIPLGLFVGCMTTDFLRETSQELFSNAEGRSLSWQLVSIGCFFVLVKFISTCFSGQGQAFLLHVANGGLMQVLWLWRGLLEEREGGNVKNSFLSQDASAAVDADD